MLKRLKYFAIGNDYQTVTDGSQDKHKTETLFFVQSVIERAKNSPQCIIKIFLQLIHCGY